MAKQKAYYQLHGWPHRVHVKVWLDTIQSPLLPGYHIDHINGDIHDNRPENLRYVPHGANIWNMKTPTSNKTGLKGLSRRGNKWRGTVTAYGRQRSKVSDDLLEVAAWIHRTRKELHGEYARY